MEYIETIRTLVVDDSDFFASLTADQLETEHGIQTVKATSADEALATLETGSFDCIVSDYDMPEMDGLDLYQQLSDSGSELPFILLTSRTDDEIVTEAITMGVDDYIRKGDVSQQDGFTVVANRIENVVSHRKTRQEYETVIDSMPENIAQVDHEGTILAANETVAATFGLSPSEMIGQTVADVLPAEIASQWRTAGSEALATGERVQFQSDHDGSHYDTIVVPADSRDDGGTYQVIARDVTDRVERERQLEETTEQLELINRFVRHDIRNDINLVYMWSEMLGDHVDDTGQEYVAKIHDASEHINELTETAQEFVRIVSGEAGVSTEPVSLRRLLTDELDKRKQSYGEATFALNHEIPDVQVRANEMLSSVFRNLLNNAVQHNDSDQPEVRISVDIDEESVRVVIADNGPGIPENQRAEIFGKGEQGADSSGSGIGLYLVHTIVSQYGGDVWVEDSHLGGAAFVVELQLAESDSRW
ncbi:ATP-binding protein [Halobacteriaceae archaeon SHR40]|uniref:hybrid sensor histidine kinase/response regulator n=1 Tax=Halovenus amylolytica TaxID=2500550 RepID=UPI000FE3F6B4